MTRKILRKILLLTVFIFFAQRYLFAEKKIVVRDTTIVFKVWGNCEMCKDRIEEAAKGKGVKSAIWDVDTKFLTLDYDPSLTTTEKVQQRIADVGHDTEFKKAKAYIYKELPDCCRYRDNDLTHHDNNDNGA